MSAENKAHCMRIYDEVFNEGKLEVVDEVISADAIDHSPPPNSTGDVRENLKEFARSFDGRSRMLASRSRR
jgi:predicted SnoaL-like aldol condensation-catalyzing enzyme